MKGSANWFKVVFMSSYSLTLAANVMESPSRSLSFCNNYLNSRIRESQPTPGPHGFQLDETQVFPGDHRQITYL